MALENHIERKSLLRTWSSGVWGLSDYYTKLDQKARDGAQMTPGYVLMVLASAAMATCGLLINSSAVVIGSMCIAPFLGPSRAVCIGGLFRDLKTLWRGLVKQFFGLLFLGSGTAFIITAFLQNYVPGVKLTHQILLRSMPDTLHIVLSIFIAVTAGTAASLALSAESRIANVPWGEVLDTVIGVEIAISLIPPAAVIGIGLAFGRLDISWKAFSLLVVNVLGLDFFGSMLMLWLHGVKVKYLTLETTIRRTVESGMAKILGAIPVRSTISVTLLNPTAVKVQATVRYQASGIALPSLAQNIGDEIKNKLGYRSEVMVEAIPCHTYSTI